MVCWHASKCSVVVYILKGAGLCLFCYLMMVQIVLHVLVNLAVGIGSVEWWFGAGLTTFILIKRLLCRITIVYTLHFFYVHVIIPELNGVTTGARLKKSPPTPTPIVPAPSESPPSLDLNIFPSAAAL